MNGRLARSAVALLFAAGLTAGAAASRAAETQEAAPAAPLPAKADDLVTYVTSALTAHDIDAFERLVEWKGARPIRKRMTLSQIRYSFGRPIKTAVVEPFPADGFQTAKAMLDLGPNLPVTEQLRVVFDEPATSFGEQPTSVFLLGREDGVYRVSLLLAKAPPK